MPKYLKKIDSNFPKFDSLRGKKIDLNEIKRRILIICKYVDFTFIDFAEDWKGYNTYLILRCNKCNKTWNTTNYQRLVNIGITCPHCKKETLDDFPTFERLISNKLTKEIAIERINTIRNYYSNIYEFKGFCDKEGNTKDWQGNKTCLKLFCLKHNREFIISYINFVHNKQKCIKCSRPNYIESQEELLNIIEKECIKRNYKFYGFTTEWKGMNDTYMSLECLNCGNKWKTTSVSSFVAGSGCKKCAMIALTENNKLDENIALENIKEWIKNNNTTFLGFCDKNLNPTQWKSTHETYLKLKCNKCNYIWPMLYYNLKYGYNCPNCKEYVLEREIEKILIENEIVFIKHDRLTLNGLELDFYIPSKKIAIECQGIQHFKPIEFFGGKESLEAQIERDNRKRKLCEQKEINLIYYSNLGIEYPYKVYENKEDLIKFINEN